MVDLPAGRRATRIGLTGHSGAVLTLIEAGGQRFVRKQARLASQNERLAAQCDKLRRAHAAGIACPAVYRSGRLDDLFWFDMAFIPADSLAHVLIAGREPDWQTLLPRIAALPALFRQTEAGTIPAEEFRAKLASIATACLTNPVVAPESDRISCYVDRLLDCDWGGIPRSECHGDFTLENILVRADRSVVAIDFDVPEQSAWWLDIAKLFQDLLGHWCLRHLVVADPEGIAVLNAQLALSRAAARFEGLFGPMIPGGMVRLRPMVAFHLLRTLPYAGDSLVVGYVLRRIGAVLEE